MFEKQLIRCSALGKLMTNDRSGKKMGETAKSYLQELYMEVKFGIRKDIFSKFINKGLMVEESAIAFLSHVHKDFYTKNDEWLSNKYISGTPDIIKDGIIRDIKSSWDAKTFPMFETELPNKHYFYQVQGYMWLTGCETAYVDYVLIDTPDQLIEDEKRKACWRLELIDGEVFDNVCNLIEMSHRFSQIPDELRFKSFEVKRDEQVIESIKSRILEAREYLKSL
jgi:hypothetical protein